MKATKIVFVLSLFILFSSCAGFGKKLEYNGTEVYYLDSVTEAEAKQLGEFLVEGEFADGNRKSVQLSRDADSKNLVFKMVVSDEAVDNPSFEYVFKAFTTELMAEFDETVDFHVTDNTFSTIKVYKGSEQARSVQALKTEVRYTPSITKDQAQRLGDYLVEQGFANNETPKTVKIDKENNIYLFKMVVDEETLNNPSSQSILRVVGAMISQNVFGKDSLRVQLCNDRFEVQKDLK